MNSWSTPRTLVSVAELKEHSATLADEGWLGRADAMMAYGVASIALVVLAHFWLSPAMSEKVEFGIFLAVIAVVARFGGARAAMATAVVVAATTLAQLTGQETDVDEMIAGLLLMTVAAVILMQFRQGSLTRLARANTHARDAIELADELSLLIEGTHEHAIFMLDPEGRVSMWNKGAERMLGWSESEVLGKPILAFRALGDTAMDKSAASLEEARNKGSAAYEARLRRKDGWEFRASIALTALYDGIGRLRGFGKVVHDITRERAATEAIEASEAHLRRLVSAVPDALVVTDMTGAILTFNTAAERMFGYGEDEIRGSNITLLMQPEDADRHPANMARYAASAALRVSGMERLLTGMRRDGTTFPHSITIEEIGTGAERLLMAFMRDMTETRDATIKMEEMQARLLHVSRLSAMGTMASTLAHELNQPITAIANYIGAAQDLLKSPDSGKIEIVIDALESAESDTMRAGDIIRQLRKFVARGHVEETVGSLRAIINDAVMLGTMDARNRNITLHICTRAKDFQVLVDRIQIQQVLVNLIRNAIEAMESCDDRNLYIGCRSESEKTVSVTVGDSGEGVASTIAGDLFGAFSTTKSDGMGVGLSICRTIVEANGGRIWHSPREGGGAQFHFTLKKAPVAPRQEASQ